MSHYVLDGRNPVPTDLMTWARWFETADRHVACDYVGPIYVSTVFLGLDHSWGRGPPLLFETMVFADDDAHDLICRRYSTWEQAERGHIVALRYARRLAAATAASTRGLA
jgi:hypothetical protein